MKWLGRIMSLVVVIGMFSYTMFVLNNMNQQVKRIDRNLQELVSDVYKRDRKASELLMVNEIENY